jgi:hypothetical protein
MSPVRHSGAPGPVHEPFCLQLSPVPAAATPRPVVTDTLGDGYGGRRTRWVTRAAVTPAATPGSG